MLHAPWVPRRYRVGTASVPRRCRVGAVSVPRRRPRKTWKMRVWWVQQGAYIVPVHTLGKGSGDASDPLERKG